MPEAFGLTGDQILKKSASTIEPAPGIVYSTTTTTATTTTASGVTLLYQTHGSGSTWDTFNEFGSAGIPQTYRDLIIVFTGRCDQTSRKALWMRINNDSTASHYWSQGCFATGGSFSAPHFDGSSQASFIGYAERSGSLGGSALVTIANYTMTDENTSIEGQYGGFDNNGAGAGISGTTHSSYLNQNNPITRIMTFPDAGSFSSGSRFALYGRY